MGSPRSASPNYTSISVDPGSHPLSSHSSHQPAHHLGETDTYASSIPLQPRPSDSYSDKAPVTSSPTSVLWLLLASNICTLLFTIVPVLLDFPALKGPQWYVGDDVVRLVEPFVAVPLMFALVLESGVFATGSRRAQYTISTLFMLAATLYTTGAAFHSAAAMFKHPLADFILTHADLVVAYPFLTDLLLWIRTTWEHNVSHYMYAAGGMCMSFVVAYVYRDVNAHDGFGVVQRTVWAAAAVIYGLIIGSVAIEFPMGSLVALILILGYGFGILATFLYRREGFRGMFRWGRRYVVQYYVMSYCIGLVIVVAWMVHAKGFRNREEIGNKIS
ncbi:uncharacterized protein EV422DRAFT_37713 [Fimicolochytrium jonesii]|uniref:uncharacterized protein n=1 Tax=Fimicolochytrium jonesii TaxID=1396493 RepID=UPI0022FEDEC7|nr:uncharacterized protein EV422DRAFT_37713 [Fimicolochytrium jonesii]KAI8821318.1 hypothetical protein EV422DRAFT_37713 [Fimicolochytrium jonesii]